MEEVLQAPLVVGHVGDRALLDQLLRGEHPTTASEPNQAPLHFAAYAHVVESVTDPAKYSRNNLGDANVLLEALNAEGESRGTTHLTVVFSSSCASYGIPEPKQIPIYDGFPQRPINLYGRGKWMEEQLLADFGAAYRLLSMISRYFNVAGADPAGDLGEDHTPETHLIPLVLDAMAGLPPDLQIYGDDYSRPDGTCICDYTLVTGLADAHFLGLQKLLVESDQHVFNLGYGNGYSVQQVFDEAKQVTGRNLRTQMAPRRPGDPPIMVSSAQKVLYDLALRPRFPELTTILEHAWRRH